LPFKNIICSHSHLRIKKFGKRLIASIISFFLLVWIFAGIALAQSKIEKKSPLVVASINPVYQIISAIIQDKNNSILIIKSAASEHNSQLKKSDIEAISKADLIFYIDDELERSFAKSVKNLGLQNKAYQISKVDNIKLLPKRNNPKKPDLHLWLNPKNAVVIAEFITQKLSEIDEKNSEKYQKNLGNFKKEIAKAEKKIKDQLALANSSSYVFYHDGYQYFENYFDLKPVKIISHFHDYELGMKDLRDFDSLAKTLQIKCLFGEISDEKNSALKLAQNYKIKFVALDLIGTKENPDKNKNGYSVLLLNLADDMVSCLH
jgi:zinc transport system substrate-binding protein